MTLRGRWGPTDVFTTTPFYQVLSLAALKLAKSISVHSLILSSQLFFCLLFLLFFLPLCPVELSLLSQSPGDVAKPLPFSEFVIFSNGCFHCHDTYTLDIVKERNLSTRAFVPILLIILFHRIYVKEMLKSNMFKPVAAWIFL